MGGGCWTRRRTASCVCLWPIACLRSNTAQYMLPARMFGVQAFKQAKRTEYQEAKAKVGGKNREHPSNPAQAADAPETMG